MIEAYRLFRIAGHKLPEVLFHPLNGTKILLLNTWLEAEAKQVWNPGKKTGPGYISGFHVCLDKQEVENYVLRFKEPKKLVVCKVLVKGVGPKPNARSNIQLADWMYINSIDWHFALRGQ